MDTHFQFYSVTETARRLGMTDGRVRQLLLDGTLHGHKLGEQPGATWAVPCNEVERYAAIEQTTGRPRKGQPSA